jgi:hypothetical protein
MVIVSVISIFMFSLLAAYMTMTNLTKSSTNAYIDGTNTFYAAESGLNKRAQQLREKFIGYELPSSNGSTVAVATPATFISNCFPVETTAVPTNNDFECRNYSFRYNNNAATSKSSDGSIVLNDVNNNSNSVNYTAYTFVSANQNYAIAPPTPRPIPAGQTYAGLNALEYIYTVFSTAAKPTSDNLIQQGDAKIVLQMNFRSRIVPLFQFAVFYDGDLEMNSSSNMTISGRVHTNANLYVQPYTNSNIISTTFLSPVTAVGSIYNRVDSMNAPNLAYAGITNVLTTGADCATGTCVPFPAFVLANQAPLTALQLAAYGGNVRDGAAGTQRLDTPPPGFLRKRNYFQSGSPNFKSNAGEYYAKADMRLEMVPDRDVTDITPTPWTRDTRIIPFNFTSITTGGTGTCTTTLPPADPSTTGIPTLTSDPAANYIDPDRNNASSRRCNVFTKGQLQSLRQPVLVLTNINQPNAALRTNEGTALGIPTTIPAAPALSISTANTQILRALQVALVSTPSPVALDRLNTAFSDSNYDTGSLNTFKTEFSRLINNITTLSAADRTTLLASSPNAIAALGGAWFLPAPIQRIETNNLQEAARNLRSSGFYDGRERRWMTMLQTNIASLSVWNRDGLYVEATTAATGTASPDTTLTTAYQTNNDMKNAAFNSGAGANLTNGLAFDRAATIAATAKGLQAYGLGSIDNTEGGLVFHATVSDDLNGDGIMAEANDVSLDIINSVKKTDAVGNLVGADNRPLALGAAPIVIDYPRKYRNGNRFQSPFGFAFNGGNYLPAPLSLITDQAIYVQGNFNNNGAIQPAAARNVPDPNRLPASIIGDTITILSNQCLSNSSTNNANNALLVPAGQLSCGLPRVATGSVDVGGATYYNVTAPTAVNAAFLSNTDRSNGNLGAGRGYSTGAGAAGNQFSGAINNYIRMLENWGGANGQFFNYSGSFVSLGTPLEYSGAYFPGGTYYNIPSRNFNFEPNFNNFTSLPPLPPRAIYLQQDVFKRNYN